MRRRLFTLVAIAATGVAAALGATPGTAETAADSCLRGQFKMSSAAATAMLQSLIGSSELRITRGALTAAFDARNGQYGSADYTVEATFGDLTLKGKGTFLNVFRYTTRNGRIVLQGGTTTREMTSLTGIKDGRTVTVPGTAPTTRRIPSGGSVAYTCTRARLRWQIPLNNTWATFQRVR